MLSQVYVTVNTLIHIHIEVRVCLCVCVYIFVCVCVRESVCMSACSQSTHRNKEVQGEGENNMYTQAYDDIIQIHV